MVGMRLFVLLIQTARFKARNELIHPRPFSFVTFSNEKLNCKPIILIYFYKDIVLIY